MKSLYIIAASALINGLVFAPTYAQEVKIGIVMGFTGPVESMIPAMAAGTELAMREVSCKTRDLT